MWVLRIDFIFLFISLVQLRPLATEYTSASQSSSVVIIPLYMLYDGKEKLKDDIKPKNHIFAVIFDPKDSTSVF